MVLELLRRGAAAAGGLPGGGTVVRAAGHAGASGVRAAAVPVRRTGRVLGGVGSAAARALRPARTVHRYPERLHIELRHLHKAGRRSEAQALERAIEGLPAVRWARVNAALGRLIVHVSEEVPPEAVLEVVEALDAVLEGEEPEAGRFAAPPTALALGADLVGLTITGAQWMLGRALLPSEVAGLVAFADAVPVLRGVLAGVVPGAPVERWLPLTQAAAQAFAPGGTGLVVDVAQRLWQRREAAATGRLWRVAEADLTGAPERAGCTGVSGGRSHDLRDGPPERHAGRMLSVGLGGLVLGGLLTGSARRALDVGVAAVPKAPHAAREIFAAELSTRLAERGVLPLDPAALRHLDRIDTVVLDADVLQAADLVVDEVAVLGDASEAEVAERVHALSAPGALEEVREADGWSLGPAASVLPGGEVPAEGRDLRGSGPVLALAEGGRPRALIRMRRSLREETNAWVTAAREAGVKLVLAGSGVDLPLPPDETAPGGPDLAASVRALQEDGAGVLLVSLDPVALAAADVGVAAWADGTGGTPPWGAHLLVLRDPAAAAHVLQAVAAARRVSERGVTLAWSGTGVAALLALTGPPGKAADRALSAVNGAAALGMAYGAWSAREVMRRVAAPTLPSTPWHSMPVEAVLERLGSRAGGLSDAEARDRGARGADRADRGGDRRTLARAVVQELANPLTAVLAAGAAGAAAVGSPVDAALVAATIGLSGLVGGRQRVSADEVIARISARSGEPVGVLRDGEETRVPADRLLRGDVLVLAAGDAVPADCRIVTANGLEADESSLTGESLPTPKGTAPTLARHVAERGCMLYEGTTIAAGNCTAAVVALGDATETGRAMAAALASGSPSSGVEARLKQITEATTPMAVGAAVGVVTSGLLRGGPLRRALSEGVNLAVASVPEGLPLLVSAAQVAAIKRLADRGVFVRDPRTIETLGRVDVLCFDKTGTLTEGRITLARIADHRHDGDAARPDDPLRGVLAAALRATPVPGNGRHSHVTDAAVDEGAARAGVDRDFGGPWKQIHSVPFEPSRAFHATLGSSGGDRTLFVKGAPEVVLPLCARTPDGDLDRRARRHLRKRVERLASGGHRVLAVAERRMPGGGETIGEDAVTGMTFLGLLGLADTVRATAAPAVADLRAAGVQIIMLTGDHPATAAAIADQVAGEGAEHRVITADEIDRLGDDALAEALVGVDVVARCTPVHKVRVVRALRGRGRVVAMTGDGANDAAGIRLADVGIALGRRGTAAAQASADLIVADDRLETIVSALVEGRAMWASVREALAILVGGNLGEIAFTLLGSLMTGRAPLSARQMLLMNMLTDLAPALAVAVRVPTREATTALLAEGPETSLGSALTRDIAHRAAVTTFGALAGWLAGRFTGPAVRARTIGLVALIGTQLAQTLMAGHDDRSVLLSTLGSAALLAVIVQTPGVSGFFGCVPLDPLAWAVAAAAVAAAMAGGRLLFSGDGLRGGEGQGAGQGGAGAQG
ncbi:magnesium-transporting ATPase (P-type) [Actinomadura coerulea]|uniref:Magnesium-transporting ATPase (P-type) n=1 Tax=Actinomadura coerulea TaxID=46159 RepID=A0A7X0FXS2_9ACTN|nr:HAD-IC family P-type ATPase [Actinomadura coerulea]MBB6395489.1 magnesium-transporting ATPase (P-type) [Actinomadura coerulea]GGQ25914.1 haloacid dehalogenase [Actinomadura coerulea]